MIRFFHSVTAFLGRWGGRRQTVHTSLASYIPALALLESQIEAAAQSGTASVDSLSSVFSRLAAQAGCVREQAAATEQALHQFEQELIQVTECVSQIEGIVRKARLVALNGQIEAAAAGEKGRGFQVVAGETTDLAQQVTDTSRHIRSSIDRLRKHLRETSEEYVGAARSEELSNAICSSIVHLQFQDAIGQRLGHVTQLLKELREDMGGYADQQSPPDTENPWMQRMQSMYCVDDERTIHGGDETSEPPAAAAVEECDIELF